MSSAEAVSLPPLAGPPDKQSRDTAAKVLRCEQVDLRGQPAFVCVKHSKQWEPYLIGLPGIIVALIGFIIVHGLSVRRQRRDEQFKMVQATRDLIASVSKEAEEAWLERKGRSAKAPLLIQRVGRIGRAIQQLRVRHKSLDVSALVTGFRQSVTLDFEDGSVSADRGAEIAIAAAELDEQIILQFLRRYG